MKFWLYYVLVPEVSGLLFLSIRIFTRSVLDPPDLVWRGADRVDPDNLRPFLAI